MSHLLRVGLALGLLAIAVTALAQAPAITPESTIDQQKLEAGQYPLSKVLRSGQRFFTTPYTPYDPVTKQGDGYGEGPLYDANTGKHIYANQTRLGGPRWTSRQVFYEGAFNGWPFLRLNGLDSQSCFECHNSIGNYFVQKEYGGGYTRKPGGVGGSAGSNANAFINTGFPNQLTYLVRNPPHVFGTGYTQTLGDEMTLELAGEVKVARAAAKRAPNTPVKANLSAKGLSFGSMTTTYKPPAGGAIPGVLVGCEDLCNPGTLTPYHPPDNYTDDVTLTTGVSCDFVIRPFQWKGISSSVRDFAHDALDFHFSMQAVEKYGHQDCDLDGKIDEMTLGNVSALVSFVAMTRPPIQVNMNDPSVVRGRQFFTTGAPIQTVAATQLCSTCHIPAMTLYSSKLFVDDPGVAQQLPGDCQDPKARALNPFFSALGAPSPADQAPYFTHLGGLLNNPPSPTTGLPCPPPGQNGYCIDLTNLPLDVPEQELPRLPKTGNTISVPLFSDLRTHDMGDELADMDENGLGLIQGTDVAGLCITSHYFLTRPLWGVGDTGPWLHDGRALTLKDAILMHGGEAAPAVTLFKALNASQQQDVVNFLLSLNLPCVNSIKCPPPPPPSLLTAAAEDGDR